MAQNTVNHGEGLRLPETSSRCVTDGAIHNFELNNWALLEGLGVGQFVTSSNFNAGGYDWNIKFYPDGDRKDIAGYASVFLSCLNPQAKNRIRAKYTLTMQDDQGKIYASSQGKGIIFSPETPSWGYPKFVEKSKLESSPHLYLTIRWVLFVIKEPPAECNRNPIVVPMAELPGHLERILENGTCVDVTFLVGGSEFKAHSLILAARSPVFEAQLFGTMRNKNTQHIVVDDMEPAIFEMLLHFIYTDSLSPCNEEDYDVATMQHLLVAADRYGLDRLKVMCEDKLCNSIGVKTVTSTLALANQHYCERLKDACVNFMSKPGVTGAVLLSEGFQSLIARCTPLVFEKDKKDKEVPAKRKLDKIG
ncbi:BTB/POZ and MATH domain-containing protein 2-like [Lolium rigidum]|uniref:BTB/POZ and MATH domain-containing protein 2-like n=1 Tax=Lolium rigidum TaxID=89674 RepID=UPI001F5C5EB2|nr:BTB/POZ and MATH domain-containing protein 2-like [Lolium rigidum]